MPRFIVLYVFVLAALLSGCAAERPADSPEIVIDNLVAGHVLNETQRPVMVRYLKGQSSPSYVVRALIDVLWEAGHEHPESNTSDSAALHDEVMLSQQPGYSEDLLDVLHDSNIINDRTYRMYFPAVQAGHFPQALPLLRMLQHDVDYAERMSDTTLLAFADSLRASGVVPDSRYASLRDAITGKKIVLRSQLLDYTARSVRFDLQEYPQDPQQFVTQLYTRIAGLFPELPVTDFTLVRLDTAARAAMPASRVRVAVSFKVNRIVYRCVTRLYTAVPEVFRYNGYLIENDFYQVFNQVLIDAKSPYRLHRIPDDPDIFKSSPGQYFGILALTKPQQRILDSPGSFFTMANHEVYEGRLSITQVEEAMNDIERLGITAHLTQQQIDSTRSRIELERPETLAKLLCYYPDVVYSFDFRFSHSNHPYTDIVMRLSRISHGAFRPTNIRDGFLNRAYDASNTLHRASFTFSFAGKTYTRDITVSEYTIDSIFPRYIFSIVAAANLPGNFYDCVIESKAVHYLYLTPHQAEVLSRNYVITLLELP